MLCWELHRAEFIAVDGIPSSALLVRSSAPLRGSAVSIGDTGGKRTLDGHGDSGLIQRLARAVVTFVVTGIIGLVAGYSVGPEHFWLLALAQYVPYPAFLLTSLVASLPAAIVVSLGAPEVVAKLPWLAWNRFCPSGILGPP